MYTAVVLVLALAASTFAVDVVRGYHDEIGFPLAAKIKAYEESLSQEQINSRIIGGALAPTNAHPYFAGLLISFSHTSGQSVCGSSLLSNNRLLTAAHCWSDGRNPQAAMFTVILGSNYLFWGGIRINTNRVIMHPQWNPATLNDDVAMIQLTTTISFNAAIQPIDIPNANEVFNLFVGNWATAVGFGATNDIMQSASTVVSHVNLRVITNDECFRTFGSPWIVGSTLCTSGAGFVGVCGGDSGGPLAMMLNGRQVVVGVASFVASIGCTLGHPSAFARVTSFRNFIVQNM